MSNHAQKAADPMGRRRRLLFTALPREFSVVAHLLGEGALYPLKQFPELSGFIRSIFTVEKPTGEFRYEFVFSLPDGWGDAVAREIEAAYQDFEL